MDRALIENWNERVHNDDRVYILGDLLYRCEDPIAILKQLKGRKHLIVGNMITPGLASPGSRTSSFQSPTMPRSMTGPTS